MTGRLDGRIALITGASRGIGAAVARRFAAEGAQLILAARTSGALEELDDEIQAAGGLRPTLVPIDLADGELINQMGAAIHERFGRLDVLVANAGVLGGLRPVSHYSPDLWDEAIDINLSANWRLIRSLDALLRTSDAGRAIFVTSRITTAIDGRPYWAPYAASKAGLEALVMSWAAELHKTHLKVNLIDPGPVTTRMRTEAFPGEDPTTIASPEDVAQDFLGLAEASCERHGERVVAGS